MEFARSIWGELSDMGDGARGERLPRAAGATLGAAVYELEPGADSGDYHFHHGNEELLIVLRGRPSLRVPAGERELDEGEVVHFVRGPQGAHQLVNRSDGIVRYIMAGAHGSPEIIEYPERGTVCAMARTESQNGQPLLSFYRIADAFDRDAD